MTPETLLLVPAKDDTALLADEPGGGVVPAASLDPDTGAWIPGGAYGRTQALLLVHEGRPVPLAVFRAWDQTGNVDSSYLENALYGPTPVADTKNALYGPTPVADTKTLALRYVSAHPGARIIRLRGGVEVAS